MVGVNSWVRVERPGHTSEPNDFLIEIKNSNFLILMIIYINKYFNCITGFCGVVVITSALHAEGLRFDPGQNLLFFPFKNCNFSN